MDRVKGEHTRAGETPEGTASKGRPNSDEVAMRLPLLAPRKASHARIGHNKRP